MTAQNNKLNIFLADIAALNIKIHNLHWNVIGREFKSVHKMTDKMYEMLQEQFDETAEIMKMNNEFPLATLGDYLEATNIEEIESRPYPVDEVLDILNKDCRLLIQSAKEAHKEAEENKNFLASNLLEDYLAKYAKKAWMLKAMIED